MKRIFIILAVGLFARGAFAAVDTLDLADNTRGAWGNGLFGRIYDTNKGELWVQPDTIHVKYTGYVANWWCGMCVTFVNNSAYNLTIEYGYPPGIGRITFPGYQYRIFIFTDNVLCASSTN
jgi:hypothetical protein